MGSLGEAVKKRLVLQLENHKISRLKSNNNSKKNQVVVEKIDYYESRNHLLNL